MAVLPPPMITYPAEGFATLVSAPTGMAVAKPLQDPTRHHLLTNEEEAAVPRTNEIKAFRANEEVAIGCVQQSGVRGGSEQPALSSAR